jgi:hypothetical protein
MRAAALYVSNWWFIAEDARYFGSDVASNPVLHYWSLSVEELSPLATFAVVAVVATAIAAVSHVLLEPPIRRNDRLDRLGGPVVAVAAAASILVGLLVVPSVLERSVDPTVAAADGSAGAPTEVDWAAALGNVYDEELCGSGGAAACALHEGTSQRVLVVGDSHAAMLLPRRATQWSTDGWCSTTGTT